MEHTTALLLWKPLILRRMHYILRVLYFSNYTLKTTPLFSFYFTGYPLSDYNGTNIVSDSLISVSHVFFLFLQNWHSSNLYLCIGGLWLHQFRSLNSLRSVNSKGPVQIRPRSLTVTIVCFLWFTIFSSYNITTTKRSNSWMYLTEYSVRTN